MRKISYFIFIAVLLLMSILLFVMPLLGAPGDKLFYSMIAIMFGGPLLVFFSLINVVIFFARFRKGEHTKADKIIFSLGAFALFVSLMFAVFAGL